MSQRERLRRLLDATQTSVPAIRERIRVARRLGAPVLIVATDELEALANDLDDLALLLTTDPPHPPRAA